MTVTGPETVFEGAPIELNVVASDPNGDELTFTLKDAAGAAVTFATEDGEDGAMLMRFTAPQVDAITSSDYTIIASDGAFGTVTSIEIEVLDTLAGGERIVFTQVEGDGASIVSTLWMLQTGASAPAKLYEGAAGVSFVEKAMSPNGEWLAVRLRDAADGNANSLKIISVLNGNESIDYLEDMTNAAVVAGGFQWLADSSAVVFKADGRFAEVDEVFAITTPPQDAATSLRRISGELPDDGDMIPDGAVTSFEVAPDGGFTTLLGDLERDGFTEVFVTNIDGERRRVSGPVQDDAGRFDAGIWSYDGSLLAFKGDPEGDEADALYVADPLETDSARVVSGDLPDQGEVNLFEWSPLSGEIVFSDKPLGLSGFAQRVYWVDAVADPVMPRVIAAEDPPPTTIRNLVWSPNGENIAFQLDSFFGGPVYSLFVVSSRSEDPAEYTLAIPGAIGRELVEQIPAWSPDSEQVLLFHRELEGRKGFLSAYSMETESVTVLQEFDAGPVLPRIECTFSKTEWSPEQAMLATTCPMPDGPFKNTVIINAGAESPPYRSVIFHGFKASEYTWSADGERLFLSALSPSDGCQLFVTTLATANTPQCLHTPTTGQTINKFWLVDESGMRE